MKLSVLALCLASTLPAAAIGQTMNYGPRIVTGTPVTAFSGAYLGFTIDRGNGDLIANGQFGETLEASSGTRSLGSPSGLATGLRGGVDIRSGNVVFGGLIDVKRSWYDDSVHRFIPPSSTASWDVTVDSTATAALRLGYDVGGVLVYALAGYSWMDSSIKTQSTQYDDTIGAPTYGGGFETQIGYHTSGFLEWRTTSGAFDSGGITADLDIMNIAIGMNYRF